MSVLLTVVTVTRDDAAGLADTLHSLTAQEGVDWSLVEHVVVDGASRDATSEVFATRASPVSSFLSEPDRGVYDAMNKGLARARGRFVQFLNSGDRFADERALAACLEALAADPVWLVAGAVDAHGGARARHRIANLPHRWWRHALGLQPHCHQSTFLSTAALRQMGGHDEAAGFVADFDSLLRFGMLASPAELDRVVVDYAGGGVSEQRMLEIPRALSDVRRRRMQLSGAAARLDRAWAGWQRSRIRAGRVARR